MKSNKLIGQRIQAVRSDSFKKQVLQGYKLDTSKKGGCMCGKVKKVL